MAAEIIITTDKGVLDLYQGAENDFFINRQVHDLHNFQNRNADFSKNLEVPPTANNLAILDAEQNDPEEAGVPCSVIMGGVMIAPAALMYYIGTKTSAKRDVIRIQILYGNFNFINSIVAGTIDEINWADLAQTWEPLPLRTASLKTTDFVFPMADWAAAGSRPVASPNQIDVNHAGFFMYCLEIMTRIIDEAGFILELADNLPADFSAIALACPVTKFLSIQDLSQVSVSQFVLNTAPQSVTDIFERIIFQDDADTTIWDDGLNQWNISVAETFTFEIAGTFSQVVQGVRPDSQIRIIRNGTTIATFFILGNQIDTAFFVSSTIAAIPGDVVFAEIESFDPQALVTVESGTRFKISTAGADVDRTVQISQFMPKIERKVFFTSMLNIFNLVMLTDDITKTVTIRNFNDVFNSAEQDLTNKFDIADDIESVPGLDSLGRSSLFTWQNDNLFRDDFDLTIRFNNDILAPQKIVIALPYSAADSSLNFITPLTTSLKVRVPMYATETEFIDGGTITFSNINLPSGTFVLSDDVNFQIGDWFVFLSNTYRIISKLSDAAGGMEGPLIAGSIGTELRAIVSYTEQSQSPRLAIMNIDGSGEELDITQGRDVPESQFDIASQTATWLDRLRWEELADDYYFELLNALKTPMVVKGHFNLSVFDFIQLDHLRPVYIDQLNAFFYINKIEQFKLGHTTRLELIRISTLTT